MAILLSQAQHIEPRFFIQTDETDKNINYKKNRISFFGVSVVATTPAYKFNKVGKLQMVSRSDPADDYLVKE